MRSSGTPWRTATRSVAALIGVAILLLWCAPASAATPIRAATRVLILHSYHHGYQWTDQQDDGIRHALRAIRPDAEPEVLFLDWKRHPTDANLDAMEAVVGRRFAATLPDLIITTDDAALAFGLRLRNRLFGPVPLVFGGVLRTAAEPLIRDEPDVTGVYEPKDVAGTIAMALQVNPGYRRVYLISDDTESGRGVDQELHGILDAMGSPLEPHSLGNLPLVQLVDRLATLPPDSFALYGSYSVDAQGVALAPERFVERMSERSAVPIFGLQEMLLGNGLFGGSLMSAHDYGQTVGTLAAHILNGTEDAGRPPFVGSSLVRAVDFRQARRYGLDPARIGGLDRVVGRPLSFVEAYRTPILWLGSIILVLGGLSVGLALVLRLHWRAELALQAVNAELMDSRQRLQATVANLTASQDGLRRNEQRLRLVMDSARDIIWDWDLERDRRSLSGRVHEVLGYDADEIDDPAAWEAAIHPEDRDGAVAALRRHRKGEAAEYQAEYRMRHKDGHYVWLSASGRTLFDDQGRAVLMAGSYTDVTVERQRQERLDRLAHYDVLTGLPNRLRLAEHVDELLAKEKASGRNHSLALLFLDMDNFKFINDSFGHKAGDALLVEFGRRLASVTKGGFVSRLGGDEFVVVVHDADAGAAAEVARDLERSFRTPFIVEGQNFFISCSIGIARYPWDGRCFDELLQNADTAMYWSKDAGAGHVSLFAPDMNRNIVDRVRLLSRLRTALEDEAFSIEFQPQVATVDGSVRGFEALIRWTDAELGAVSPGRFIPACEDSGMIIPLGRWVLDAACRQAVALAAQGLTDVKMSVNISVVQLAQADFVPSVLQVLDATGLPPQTLQLEITESLMMGSFKLAVAKLNELGRHGIGIALDDFGTGYSSLTYLRQLPIDVLKLDKGFIDDVARSPDAHGMVTSIIRMASDMKRVVVAEGVEDEEQWETLSRIGCDLIQGYFISPPLPANRLDHFLREWEWRRNRMPLVNPKGQVIGLAGRHGRSP